jgi:hypothetical protein
MTVMAEDYDAGVNADFTFLIKRIKKWKNMF